MPDRDKLPRFDAATLSSPLQWEGRSIWRTDLKVIQMSTGTSWELLGPVSGAGIASRVSLYSKNANPGRAVEDVATTSGSNQISSATAAFDSSDIGSLFTLCDPTDYTRVVNGTVISVQSATVCTLSTSVGYTATGVGMALGRDNTQAISDAVASLSVSRRYAALFVPEGIFLTTAAFRVLDGQSIYGAGKDYGLATMPVGAGSAIILASALASSTAFFQLGNFAGGFSSGQTGSTMEGVVIDAANNADWAVWARCRRARVRHAGIWRGKARTLYWSAQNGTCLDVIAAAQNIGNVVHVDGSNAADSKFLHSEFRQGGAASFSASTGHQVYIENPGNVLLEQCHMYAGFSGQVYSTAQGANIMVRKLDSSPSGNVTIVGCEMDGTYGPKLHARNEGTSRLHGIQFIGNQCYSVAGELDARFGIVELANTGGGSIRGVCVNNNFINHVVSGRNYKGIVAVQNIDGTATGLSGTYTHMSITGNTALGVSGIASGFTPTAGTTGNNVWAAAGSVTENVG